MFIYKIDVIKALKDKGYNSTKILKENIVSQSTMQKFRNNQMVSIESLDKICDLLDCQIEDIITHVKKVD